MKIILTNRRRLFLDVLGAVSSGLTVPIALRMIYRQNPRFYLPFLDAMGFYRRAIVITLVVLLAGVIAHRLKSWNQHWYGVIEIAFGGGSALSVAMGIKPGEPMFAKWASLMAWAYVVARGLNNRADAIRNERIA
jgi:hypothetical protein